MIVVCFPSTIYLDVFQNFCERAVAIVDTYVSNGAYVGVCIQTRDLPHISWVRPPRRLARTTVRVENDEKLYFGMVSYAGMRAG
jgi:hypothetical protein